MFANFKPQDVTNTPIKDGVVSFIVRESKIVSEENEAGENIPVGLSFVVHCTDTKTGSHNTTEKFILNSEDEEILKIINYRMGKFFLAIGELDRYKAGRFQDIEKVNGKKGKCLIGRVEGKNMDDKGNPKKYIKIKEYIDPKVDTKMA